MATGDGARSRVLVLSMRSLTEDVRLLRQVESLAPEYDVVVASPAAPAPVENVEFVSLSGDSRSSPWLGKAEAATRAGLRIAGLYGHAYWLSADRRRWREELKHVLPVHAILVAEPSALPLARALGPVPLVYDAQEHWTSESVSWTARQRLSMRHSHEWLVDRFVPQTAAMMTVSPGIAKDFEQRTGVRPTLVVNAPPFQPLRPSPVTEPIRLFHAGVADERRRLEGMIEAVRSLDDRFTLDMLLVRDNDYRTRLERLAASEPRIRILPPVPQRELVSVANDYDVGIYLFHALYPNAVHSLPNKLFDFIQARLAVAIGPSPAMAEIVREWDCGVISDSFDPESFAEALRTLTVAEVERMKGNSDRAAHMLTAEANRETVLSVMRAAINGAGPDR